MHTLGTLDGVPEKPLEPPNYDASTHILRDIRYDGAAYVACVSNFALVHLEPAVRHIGTTPFDVFNHSPNFFAAIVGPILLADTASMVSVPLFKRLHKSPSARQIRKLSMAAGMVGTGAATLLFETKFGVHIGHPKKPSVPDGLDTIYGMAGLTFGYIALRMQDPVRRAERIQKRNARQLRRRETAAELVRSQPQLMAGLM